MYDLSVSIRKPLHFIVSIPCLIKIYGIKHNITRFSLFDNMINSLKNIWSTPSYPEQRLKLKYSSHRKTAPSFSSWCRGAFWQWTTSKLRRNVPNRLIFPSYQWLTADVNSNAVYIFSVLLDIFVKKFWATNIISWAIFRACLLKLFQNAPAHRHTLPSPKCAGFSGLYSGAVWQ